MTPHNLLQTLKRAEIFSQADEGTLKDLARAMTIETFHAGDILMRQGEVGDCMYMVLHGRLEVTATNKQGESHKLSELGIGDIVGEMALFTQCPRSATVTAIRECSLVKISSETFEKIVHKHTHTAMQIMAKCVKRFVPYFYEKKHIINTLCFVPGTPHDSIDAFTQQMAGLLSKSIPIKVLSSEQDECKRFLNQSLSEQIAWLHALESDYELVIYVADSTMTRWTELCMRQADKLFFVVPEDIIKASETLERVLHNQSIHAEKCMVITHPPETKVPVNTQYLLNRFPVSQHFHVAKQRDIERFVRFILGKSLCLVCSGGGLRGIAHLGLLQALYERDIHVDYVGGTSFGAIPAILCAEGYSPGRIMHTFEHFFDRISNVVDLTLPVAAISKGQVLHDILLETFPPELMMEDLWIPAFCVATNVTEFKTEVLRRGPIWEALRASMALPAIFPPVIVNDNILVDGASMNNLPVDIMRELNPQGTIMASVASGKPKRSHFEDTSDVLSGWQLMLNKWVGRKHKQAPGMLETMLSASLSASTRHQHDMKKLADICIELNVSQFKLMDFKHWREIRDVGYESACKALDGE